MTGYLNSAPEALLGSPQAAEQPWLRVHPLTPVAKAWGAIVGVLLFGGYSVGVVDGEVQAYGLWSLTEHATAQILLGILTVLVVLGVLVGYLVLAWRNTAYQLDGDAVRFREGVLFRKQRIARLARIQAIDIRRPLFARIFGLAELTLEVAGGADSQVKIAFIREAEAEALRVDLLGRAARAAAGEQTGAGEQTAAGDLAIPGALAAASGPNSAVLAAAASNDVEVLRVAPGRLIKAQLLSVIPLLLLASMALTIVLTAVVGPYVLMGAVPAVVGVVIAIWAQLNSEFGFRAGIGADGIRLSRGLLETRTQTIPAGRIQAIRLSQRALWRPVDWWRVTVTVAGYYGSDAALQQSVLLPVGTRAEALTMARLAVPNLVCDESFLAEAFTGASNRGVRWFTVAPRRGWVFAPFTWRRNGFAMSSSALLLRGGWLNRSVTIVPNERTQSLCVTQGPLQRLLRLASFRVHVPVGPVQPCAKHLDPVDAAALLEAQAAVARQCRHAHRTQTTTLASAGITA